MPRTVPWHSSAEAVYHNNTDCRAGQHLHGARVREGSGGKRLCLECARRNHDVEDALHSAETTRPRPRAWLTHS